MLCNLADPDGTAVTAVIDINPGKQGGFVPVTGHPIVAPDRLRHLRPATIVVSNDRYRKEIEEDVRQGGFASAVWQLPGSLA
jgi:hypothetical protein